MLNQASGRTVDRQMFGKLDRVTAEVDMRSIAALWARALGQVRTTQSVNEYRSTLR